MPLPGSVTHPFPGPPGHSPRMTPACFSGGRNGLWVREINPSPPGTPARPRKRHRHLCHAHPPSSAQSLPCPTCAVCGLRRVSGESPWGGLLGFPPSKGRGQDDNSEMGLRGSFCAPGEATQGHPAHSRLPAPGPTVQAKRGGSQLPCPEARTPRASTRRQNLYCNQKKKDFKECALDSCYSAHLVVVRLGLNM